MNRELRRVGMRFLEEMGYLGVTRTGGYLNDRKGHFVYHVAIKRAGSKERKTPALRVVFDRKMIRGEQPDSRGYRGIVMERSTHYDGGVLDERVMRQCLELAEAVDAWALRNGTLIGEDRGLHNHPVRRYVIKG